VHLHITLQPELVNSDASSDRHLKDTGRHGLSAISKWLRTGNVDGEDLHFLPFISQRCRKARRRLVALRVVGCESIMREVRCRLNSKTTTQSLAFRATPVPRTSRKLSANWRVNIIPTKPRT